jgi:hypothetical protein
MVARRLFLLVGAFVLLIDDDDSEPVNGRKHGTPRPNNDSCRAVVDLVRRSIPIGESGMDAQALLNVAFGLAGALGGFVLKATWSDLKDMRLAIQALQNSIAETYVRRDDSRDNADDIKRTLARIEGKLDSKQDRAYVVAAPPSVIG